MTMTLQEAQIVAGYRAMDVAQQGVFRAILDRIREGETGEKALVAELSVIEGELAAIKADPEDRDTAAAIEELERLSSWLHKAARTEART